MMPYQNYDIARYRVFAAQDWAERRRQRRSSRPGAYPVGIIDAVGHGLIAIGTRLVHEPVDGGDRRAA